MSIFNKEVRKLNKSKLEYLHNLHKGKDIFVIGTSSTVNKEFLDKVKDKVTVSCNGIVFAREIWGFEPTYFCASDSELGHTLKVDPEFRVHRNGEEYSSFYEGMMNYDDTKILIHDIVFRKPKGHFKILKKLCEDNIYVSTIDWVDADADKISFNLLEGTYVGGTIVTNLCIPLAVWLGAKNIYLKGCESVDRRHFYYQKDKPREFKRGRDNLKRTYFPAIMENLKKLGIGMYNLDKDEIFDVPNINIDDII